MASLIIPAITYANALSIKSDYDAPTTSRTDKERLQTDYESARTNAYASIVVPALFMTAVGALTAWYILGARETRIPITPQAGVGPTGANVGVSARF